MSLKQSVMSHRTHLRNAFLASGIVLLSAFIILEFVRTGLLFAYMLSPNSSNAIARLHHFCHQMPQRCYYFNGKPLPLCARCVGIKIGALLAPAFLLLFRRWRNIWVGLVLMTGASIDILLKIFSVDAPNWWRTGAGVALSLFVAYALTFFLRLAFSLNHQVRSDDNGIRLPCASNHPQRSSPAVDLLICPNT